MKHFGDITKIHGADVPPVDAVIGGSPCQGLSIAGRRAGLADERSGLFMEQIRVIKEMRRSHGKPRWMVWENVPGAFSSNKGEDFGAVLHETIKIVCPKAPPLFLYLRMDGPQAAASWETNGALRGAFSMRSFGESPSAAVESRLSQILQDNPHQKYYLSAKSCLGILNRAKRRGKELPEQLRLALIQQSQGALPPDTTGAHA